MKKLLIFTIPLLFSFTLMGQNVNFSIDIPEGKAAMAGTTVKYGVTIHNDGFPLTDYYSVAISGAGTWTYTLYGPDESPLTESIMIPAGTLNHFYIKVDVPADANFRDTDTQKFTVTSEEGTPAPKTFSITTTALTVLPLPFFEGFENCVHNTPVALWGQASVVGTNVWTAMRNGTNYNRAPRTGEFNAHLYIESARWLFTPAHLELEASKTYRFSVYARQDGPDAANARITLKYGTTATPEGMTEMAKELTGITNGDYQLIEGVFQPAADGNYYLGILGELDWAGGASWYLSIDDISVEELAENDAAAISIDMPEITLLDGAVSITGTVQNQGVLDNTFSATIKVEDESAQEIFTATESVTATSTEQKIVDFGEWTPTVTGQYTLTLTVNLAGDEVVDNNSISQTIAFVEQFEAFAGNENRNTYNQFSLEYGLPSSIGVFADSPYPVAEEYADGAIYRLHSDLSLATIDRSDGTPTPLGTITGMTGAPKGLAYDWDNEVFYILVIDESKAPHLGTLNITTLVATEIGVGTGQVVAMDFANNGMLYGPTLERKLVQIDPATGATTEIGPIGISISNWEDVSFDPISGRLYTIAYSNYISKYGYYDLETGAFNMIKEMGTDLYLTFVITNSPLTYTVTLTVVDADGAIEGATVNFKEADHTTDVNGKVVIADVFNGTYTYTVSMADFNNATGNIVVDGANVEETITLSPTTGIDSDPINNLKVYPNPFSSYINITNADKVNRVIITSIIGQRVMDVTLNGKDNIDASKLTNGVYLVTFEGMKGERTVRKMIKK